MEVLNKNIYSSEIESEYSEFINISHRKKFAQFFTPFFIAELMSKWILGNPNTTSVLEPAFGLGIFSRALINLKPHLEITAYEVDEVIFSHSQQIFNNSENVKLHLKDYIYEGWNEKYDGIICNPPYFKFHDYDNKKAIAEFENKISLKLNGLTNLYCLFLVKSVLQLKQNGRAAYIIPSEFLNSDYGKTVKSFLIESGCLRHIIVIDSKENVFDDALTTACILLLANDEETENVHFTNIKKLSDLRILEAIVKGYPAASDCMTIKRESLDPEKKWRTYYETQNSSRFKDLVPFSDFGKVVRGIATGDNKYFVFNQLKAEELNIPSEFLLPCICKAADSKNSFFTSEDFEYLKKNNKQTFLFNAPKHLINENAIKYIKLGEVNGVNTRFLTSTRKPWYSLEKRPPAPIWVSVFNRKGLRFIRNEANISNLTTFHCLYIHPIYYNKIDLLFAYLLSDVSRQIFEDNRREYGNGLQKFEPNDINKSKILNLESIDNESEQNILVNYNLYRNSVIVEKKPNHAFLEKINQIFINQYLKE